MVVNFFQPGRRGKCLKLQLGSIFGLLAVDSENNQTNGGYVAHRRSAAEIDDLVEQAKSLIAGGMSKFKAAKEVGLTPNVFRLRMLKEESVSPVKRKKYKKRAKPSASVQYQDLDHVGPIEHSDERVAIVLCPRSAIKKILESL